MSETGTATRALRVAAFLLSIGSVVNGACFFGFFIYLSRTRPSAPIGAYRIEMSNHGDLYFVSVADAGGLGLLVVLAGLYLLIGVWVQRTLQRTAR